MMAEEEQGQPTPPVKKNSRERRQERRQAERAAAEREARKALESLPVTPPENEYMEAYQGGFRCGYLDAYAQLIEDLLANTTVQFCAGHLMVLPDDKVELARHVLRNAQKALRPRSSADIERGLTTAFAKHMQEAFQDLQRDEAEAAANGSEATG